MNNFFNLRNRALQSLILGLVGLTIYAYYRTTVNEIRPFVVARSGSHQLLIQVLHRPSNASVENASQPQPSRSSTLGPSASSLSRQPHENPASPSTSVVSQQLQQQQPASSSGATSIVVANETLATQRQSSRSQNDSSTGGGNGTTSVAGSAPACNDTARAIYGFGHDVAVPERCPDYGRDMDLVILVMSAPSHVEARTAIRQTWGHYGQRRDVAVLFMLGATRDPKLEKLLRQEGNLYGDVIRGRYLDSYANLTLKTISSLEWVGTYCPEVRFVLKTDDDMFINVPRLLGFVRKHERDRNVIFGRLARKWKPIRNKKSKYYVSQAQYKPPVFPDFTTGPAYLLSRDVVGKLYEAALDQTYLKLEDVFTTGIVAHKLGVRRSHANEFLNKRVAYNPCNIQRGISIHMVKYSEQFDLWKKLLDGKTKCKR